METLDRLRELAQNLYWTWHPDIIGIFRDLNPNLWRAVNHNPIAFLDQLAEDELKQKAAELVLETRITHAFHRLHEYLQDEDTWAARNAGSLRAGPVAYFSAEFGLHESLPIYSGGLGVLAGDYLQAASDLGVPVIGVGLFYGRGYFSQRLNADGWQQEEYLDLDVDQLPLTLAQDENGEPIRVAVAVGDASVSVQIWKAEVGRTRLILLDTNVDENNEEQRSLTGQLYDRETGVRLRQQVILGIGGMRALAALGIRPGVVHLNEGFCAFAPLEQGRMIMEKEGRSFEEVRERTASNVVFTTHTPDPAGHDRYDPDLLFSVIGPLREALDVPKTQFLALGRIAPDDEGESFCMTVLALTMSRFRNAVSDLHGQVTRAMWKSLWPGRPEADSPIRHITNGVHIPTWLAIPYKRLYDRSCGEGWHDRLYDAASCAAVGDIDELEFWEQHESLRANLVAFVRRRLAYQKEQRGEEFTEEDEGRCLNPSILTIGFARRFAPYKRADLLLADLDRLDHIVNNEKQPVQIVYAGKVHPANEAGKKLVQKVVQVACDHRFIGKIIFVEDYDINVARHLVQGVDVWLNTPRRPREACGTSGQKVILNGGLNLSIIDGWWAEAYDECNGFAIGDGAQRADEGRQDEHDAQSLYDMLENEVVPLFYDRDERGLPKGWIARQKNAIRSLAWRYNASRMIRDYVMGCYLPAAGSQTASFVAQPQNEPFQAPSVHKARVKLDGDRR